MLLPCLLLLGAPLALAQAPAPTTAPTAWPSTEPNWPHHPTRNITVLTGVWAFGWAPAGVDPTTVPYASISTPNTTAVPGSIDVLPSGVLGPQTTFYYRSQHACTPGFPSLITFAGVNLYSRVFADGVFLGNNTSGAYTPFDLPLHTCGPTGVRELVVVVNNAPDKIRAPTFTGGDFYSYSGIIRNVMVTEVAGPYFLRHVAPIPVDYVARTISVRIVVGGPTPPASLNIILAFSGVAPGRPIAVPVVNGVALIPNVTLAADVQLWQLGVGNTYTLSVIDVDSGDTVVVRSGMRVLGTSGGRLTVNGEVVRLVGYNRHTMWPDTGAAVTPAQEAADMALLKSLNANYVRGAHYPQSQSWLDLCDEQGIAMWEETLGPGTSTANMVDPYYMHNHLTAIASMVTTSLAHPSVFFHAFFNEGPTNDPKACVGYEASAAGIRAIANIDGAPPARLVTWADNKGPAGLCFASASVLSYNAYPGWYVNPGNVSEVPVFWGKDIAEGRAAWPEKPIFVSETGGGGIWEWRNDSSADPGLFWSQKYQATLVSADASFLSTHKDVSGLTLWQFADIKANYGDTKSYGGCDYLPHGPWGATPWDCAYIDTSVKRPGGENHKGSVDFWRRKKEVFPLVAAIYAAAKP